MSKLYAKLERELTRRAEAEEEKEGEEEVEEKAPSRLLTEQRMSMRCDHTAKRDVDSQSEFSVKG